MFSHLSLIRQFRCSNSLQVQVEAIFVVNSERLWQHRQRVVHRVGSLHIGNLCVLLRLLSLLLRLLLLRLRVVFLPHPAHCTMDSAHGMIEPGPEREPSVQTAQAHKAQNAKTAPTAHALCALCAPGVQVRELLKLLMRRHRRRESRPRRIKISLTKDTL